MKYKVYGSTGKEVSCVGFGGMRFDMDLPMEENADIVRYACSKGMNYFDTAPGYCGDKSEEIFGHAFKNMPGEFYVATKAMPTSFDTAEKTIERVKLSMERMGVSRIDFQHIWCLRKMEHYEMAIVPGGMYDGLRQLQDEGLVEHIVCSSHMPGSETRKIAEDGKVEGILLGINMLNFPYRWDGVEAAREANLGVVAMNPLAGGAIPKHEKELAFLASEGESPTEAALRFVIACPEITVALPGITTREHIDIACRIADEAKPFSAADLARIRTHLSENLDAACTGCHYCDGCPENIPIASYLQFYNDRQLFGADDAKMVEEFKFHHSYGLLVGAQALADQCTECGQCEEDCTQHLPIIERLKELALWEAQISK